MTNQEAINEICDMANSLQIMYKSKQGQAVRMGIEALKNQKTGHWEFQYNTPIGSFHKCSECGRNLFKFDEESLYENYPYCHCGAKMEGNFEIRQADRDYKVGDILILKEYEKGRYTGREIKRIIQYIYKGDGTYGVSEEFWILGLKTMEGEKNDTTN